MVWFPNSWCYLARKKYTVAMCSCFKKSKKKKKLSLREVYLLARCLMLNWSRRHAFIYATKTWNLWVFVLLFSESFREKKMYIYIYINILQEMKNGLSLRQLQLQMIMHYILTWAYKLTCRQNYSTPKKRTILLFLTLKGTEIFPKLLFWSNSWVTAQAPVFHNRFLIMNLYLMTVVTH